MNKQSAKHPDKQAQRSLALWAADCAEHVLPFFEEKRPQDDRPRKAIEAARAWVRGEIKCGAARNAAVAAHAAARDADEGAARAAARATGHAAGTAHMAGHARHAAAYAVKSVTAAGIPADKECDWQSRRLEKIRVEQATGLFRPATRRTERRRTPSNNYGQNILERPTLSVGGSPTETGWQPVPPKRYL